MSRENKGSKQAKISEVIQKRDDEDEEEEDYMSNDFLDQMHVTSEIN